MAKLKKAFDAFLYKHYGHKQTLSFQNKMFVKLLISLIFILVLFISHSIFTEKTDIKSYFFSRKQSQTPQISPPLCTPAAAAETEETKQGKQSHSSVCPVGSSPPPLRVYMYDLPRRFNLGMIDHSRSDDEPVNSKNFTQWPPHWKLLKQHSMEYWLMASLLYDGEGDDREVVRVSDPELAQLFFVPFFSSLSYNFNLHRVRTANRPNTDRQLQNDLLQFLRKSEYWKRSGGRDHVIPMQHPNALRFLRRQVKEAIFVVADFGRPSRSVSNLGKDIVTPYAHVVDTFTNDDVSDPFKSRSTLLFFRGGTHRKDEGKIRAKLTQVFSGYKDVRYEHDRPSAKTIQESTEAMRTSKFCLSPAGDTPSSCRLFDAIVSHCVPVIVSDHIELPFEDELDYNKLAIFFSVKNALKRGYIVNRLRQFPKEKWTEMWMQLKNISHHFEFQYPPKKQDAVNMLWRQVKHKVPGVQIGMHRSLRHRAAEL